MFELNEGNGCFNTLQWLQSVRSIVLSSFMIVSNEGDVYNNYTLYIQQPHADDHEAARIQCMAREGKSQYL